MKNPFTKPALTLIISVFLVYGYSFFTKTKES